MPVINQLPGAFDPRALHSNSNDLTLGVICSGNPTNVQDASGVPYFMTRALSKHVGRIAVLRSQPPLNTTSLRFASSISDRVLNRKFLPTCTVSAARLHAKQIEKQIAVERPDVILSISADPLIALLQSDVPIVYLSDATYSCMFDYYPDFARLWSWSKQQAQLINQAAIELSEAIVYPSKWAAKAAIKEFSIEPNRVHVIPHGASLISTPARDSVLSADRHRRCELLFVGRDWTRKGGRLAWNTLCNLRKRGIDAHLVVVGCQPPSYVKKDHVTVHEFLNKENAEESKQLEQCWMQATFFCLPTRADTFGAVLCEAAAYGIPAIATDTGGTATAVCDGVTGRLLPFDSQAHRYADAIAEIWYDRDKYQEMRIATRTRFEQSLNWEAWARYASAVIHETAVAR